MTESLASGDDIFGVGNSVTCKIDVIVSNGGKVLTKDYEDGCTNFKIDLDLDDNVSVDLSSWKVRVSYNDTGHDEAWRDSQMQLIDNSMKDIYALANIYEGITSS